MKKILCLIFHQPSSRNVLCAQLNRCGVVYLAGAVVRDRSHGQGSLEEAKTISHANVTDVINAV
jgi:hypothetical protein